MGLNATIEAFEVEITQEAMAEIETLRSQRVAQAETRAREITDEAQHVLDEAQAAFAQRASRPPDRRKPPY